MNESSTTTTATTTTFKLPYKVTCSHCGATKAVRHEVLLKRLAKAEGSSIQERFENHIADYLCQECRRNAKLAAMQAKLNPVEEDESHMMAAKS